MGKIDWRPEVLFRLLALHKFFALVKSYGLDLLVSTLEHSHQLFPDARGIHPAHPFPVSRNRLRLSVAVTIATGLFEPTTVSASKSPILVWSFASCGLSDMERRKHAFYFFLVFPCFLCLMRR